MLKLKLKTDFSDYYDAAFDSFGFEFRRVTTDGPNRREMFNLFRKIGLPTPLHGFINDLEGKVDEDKLFVIHTDEHSHNGEGKELSTIKKIRQITDVNYFIVEYIPTVKTAFTNYKSSSFRYLFIGNRCFKYQYISFHDWRSNYGDGDIISISEIRPYPQWRNKIDCPLFAIDFVGDDNLLAIDFNVAPGTIGTKLHKLISPSQVVLEIKHWFKIKCCDEEK